MEFNIVQHAKRILSFAAVLCVLSFSPAAKAEGVYPSAMDEYVNDYAGVLNSADSEQIRKMFKDLEYQTGIEATVVTINSIGSYGTGDTTIESFATNLFNTWGVGKKKENNGVLILVSVKDRECRIELGKGYGRRYNSLMQQVIDEKMVPYFKAEDYSRGIYEGSRGVIENITKKASWFSFYKWHLAIALLVIVCIFAGVSCTRSGKKGWGWAFFAAAGFLLLFLIRMLSKGKRSKGFGGGSSSGGGASGKW